VLLGSEREGATGLIGGTVVDDALDGSYDFYVAVFDKIAVQTYLEDPKIIVGSGGFEAKLSDALSDVTKAAKEAREEKNQNLKKIEEIERSLRELVKQ
jgi:hypothetical protein